MDMTLIISWLVWLLILLLLAGYGFLYHIRGKIERLESNIIGLFATRTDMFPALYEISRDTLQRHDDIFAEALELRKKEFNLMQTSQNLGLMIDIEKYIHHEINFIFQVCNKHPVLTKEKRFLYLRDVIIHKSQHIGKYIATYKKAIESYNHIIKLKNYSLIGLLLPFRKKTQI